MSTITYTDRSGVTPPLTVTNPIISAEEITRLKAKFEHLYNPVSQTLVLFL